MTRPFLPLAGVRILDLSRYLPGPFLTRILCDLGAEVFKVEAPGGDSLRWVPPMVEGPEGAIGAAFGSVNAGKMSIVLDLRKPEGRAVLHAMVPEVDVLVENFRPGVLARFGLDDAALERLNPRLITCSLSGFGQTGTHALRAGHDLNYMARAGVLGLCGPSDGPPAVPGAQFADLGGGALPAAIGVLAALIERGQTGRGRRLDVSLTRGALALGAIALSGAAGQVEPRGAGFLTGGLASYRCYRTADGRYLAVGALEPEFFVTFCAGIGRPELGTAGFAMGADAETVAAAIAARLAEEPLAHWLEVFEGQDVCVDPVLDPYEALAEAEGTGIVAKVDGHTVIKLDVGVGLDAPDPCGPPALGRDGLAVCAALKVDAALLDAARASGALRLPA